MKQGKSGSFYPQLGISTSEHFHQIAEKDENGSLGDE
ncbi:uncharacterized protein G2W53_008967 [Senna tora]|uniref:Uncharacterized protein n=1 Tax=Senna tora TaxID=362788 RepID=A0A834WXI7_9FABA|nr:uncharacterized protein G2W53_008967 [Senna tora]